MQNNQVYGQLNSIREQINTQNTNMAELFKLVHSRTEDIIVRQQKLQNDINDIKLFLRTRLGAPDSSRLKDIMKLRLANERFDYRG
jgi:hypothetical protein